ncbi:type 2 lanthipeptide synthetase LanM family protein [Streptomyces termitum]|uniref:Lanthionine synthetase n=1 Tax=Streptomyces termitum TaxID=67368 RepID=A0A918T5E3_9ACTN|nr:type 2 lanthipeptide synthetase LanM family protein [Streptomyces termitum]GHA98466.1 lanthionine synthetase [Streptomyces termitum]
MISPAKLYPELDSVEIRETIEPLGAFASAVHGTLSAPAAAAPQAPSAAALAWALEPETYPFQHVIRRLALPAADRLLPEDLARTVADPDAFARQVLGRAEARLRDAATRTLVAAVNQASGEGALRGSTPEARYQDFVTRAWSEAVEPFPVLRSAAGHVVRNAREAARDIVRRLHADREAVSRSFGIAPGDPLLSIGGADGDSHAHGRAVGILTFASGARLVHKPRDVSCEAAFETVVAHVNAEAGCALPAARTLVRDGYGYVEYVERQDVGDDSVPFMRACGQLAAVFYLLDARDMHFENILPTRRGPVAIDLETLLHPARVHTGPTREAEGNAYDEIGRSVYGIGILPLVLAGKDEDSGHVDLGFLGGDNQGVSPFKTMVFEHPFTDRVRVHLQARPAEQRSTVVRETTEREIHALAGQMADGFRQVCEAVMARPAGWTGLLRRIAPSLRLRYIHNPTSQYAQILRMTASAAAMADPELARALLHRIAIPSRFSDRRLIGSELRQMAERDVPYFTVPATGTAVHDCDGRDTGVRVDRTPLSRALAKAAALDEHVVRRQLRLLHSAFCSRFPDNHLSGGTPWSGRAAAGERTGLERLARTVADALTAGSLPDQYGHLPTTWIGPLASAQAARPWPSGVLGYDLYTGRTGPALALAAAAVHFGDERYARVAHEVFARSAGILTDGLYELRSIRQSGAGAYTGTTGLLYALAEAGRILREPGWVKAAQDAVPLVVEQIGPGDTPEVISGISGIATMVAAIGGDHRAGTLDALTDRLLRHTADPTGSWWEQSGFAHGVSGVLYALATLRDHAGSRVDEAIGHLTDRLEAFYVPRERNWSTNSAFPDRFSTGWCHGAAGIAMGLCAAASRTGDERAAERLETALDQTFRQGFGRNLTWCHGDLGNIDIVRRIAGAGRDRGLLDRGLLDQDLLDRADAVEASRLGPDVIAEKLADTGSRYAHTDSAMVGSSGVLLHLLGRLDGTRPRVSPIWHGTL